METWQGLVAAGALVSAVVAIIAGTLKVGAWKGKVDADRQSFKEFMDEIRADIKKIFDRLPPATSTSASPLQLTDLGKDVSEFIEAKAWASCRSGSQRRQ